MSVESVGYSGTPLYKKLGIKDGLKCIFQNVPDHYSSLFDYFPDVEVVEKRPQKKSIDFIHVFVTYQVDLKKELDYLIPLLHKGGSLWVSWPKGASKMEKDLNGSYVRTFGLKSGLVDVKVCAVDKYWSGLKFMYRLKDR